MRVGVPATGGAGCGGNGICRFRVEWYDSAPSVQVAAKQTLGRTPLQEKTP